jgi:hypothetical protein
MNDEQLDHLLERAGASYRPPPAPDLDAIWRGVEARRHPIRHRSIGRAWTLTGLAAAVVLSFTLGRVTSRAPQATLAVDTPSAPSAELPVSEVTTELLGQTVVLLTTLPAENEGRVPDSRFTQQAGALLTTTRVLLDSRAAASNPQLRNLLEDLELILAQIARLQNGNAKIDLELITEALQQQDLVPRIRTIAAGLNAGAD